MEERSATVEVEKPFRCPVCSASFTNEDHLQVHKRRHEMSLNLTKNGPAPLLGQDGFVDETPTPSRFIRNCEEVGLFQDLNPFDEQFSKASSATPTSENNFGFQFSQKITNPDDTLNTPQVLGYGTASATPLPLPRPNNPSNPIGNTGTSLSLRGIQAGAEENGTVQTGAALSASSTLTEMTDKLTSSSSQADETTVITYIPLMISEQGKPAFHSVNGKKKSKLRLNIDSTSLSALSSGETIQSGDIEDTPTGKRPESAEKKSELLERNRAAASRSRERRKLWISALEGKCEGLQSDLAKVYSELSKSRAENKILKLELSKHANCNVTLSQSPLRNKPAILRQSSQTSPTILNANTIVKSPMTPMMSTINLFQVPQVQTQIQTKSAAKRGRPRKGCEKRASLVQDIPIQNSSEVLKVQLKPLYSAPKGNSSQKVYILQS